MKAIKIERCKDCPYVNYKPLFFAGYSYICKMKGKGVKSKTIPNWCPLEDEKNKDGMFEYSSRTTITI